ncbi:MAG: hypothetical protein ACPGVF_02395 [Flavobacteriaceae bacterium]
MELIDIATHGLPTWSQSKVLGASTSAAARWVTTVTGPRWREAVSRAL